MFSARIENIKDGINAECGCYEEVCDIFPFEVTLHLEDDGTGDAFLDGGDFEIEKNFPARTMQELRKAAIKFINEFCEARISGKEGV